MIKDNQIVKSICRGCHGGCGVLVTLKDNQIVKIKGDPASPVSKGWMCIKGLKSIEVLRHPERLTMPLKKTGNKWHEVSWNDALDEIASRLDQIRQESGPEAIAIGQGTGRHHYLHVVRFANALGTPNWYEPGLAQCFIPRVTVSHLTYGGFVVADYYGPVKPACILFWGHNPLVSSADGELGISVLKAMYKCKTIAIDPRKSETAARCQMWLPIRPGTDAALALAMIHTIIEKGLYDQSFVENWTSGFEALKKHVLPFTPQWANQITWIDARDIVQAAVTYATIKPAVLEWGLGLEQNINSLQTLRAIAILRAITGNIDIPGGDILGMQILRPYPTLKNKLPMESSKKRIGAEEFKLLGGWRAYMPSAHIPGLFKAMREGTPYRIRALLLFGNNPLTTVANPKGVYEGLKQLELLVTTDLFMTPTATLSDFVLPASFWPEIDHLMGYPIAAENYVIAQRQLMQTGQCRQDEWIMDELSRRLKLPGLDMTYRDIFDYQLSSLGLTFNDIVKNGIYYPQHKYKKYEEKGFGTPSRKVELYSSSLKRIGYSPLPSYIEPPESPVSTPELLKDFPYILITGARRQEFFHSEHRQIVSLRKRRPDPCATVHVDVAKKLGIQNGDSVILSSPRGQITVKAEVTDRIHPKVISVEHGWWFPEQKAEDLFGVWEANANLLTNDLPPYDPAFGSYQLRGLLCNLRRVTP